MQMAGLAERIDDLEVIVTGTEAEALHVEQNLVKRHRPPFNIRLRDDKSFPYIAVTVEDEYPRVMFTRERHRRGVVYFGPYANAKKVRETLDVLNRVFQYRPCEGPKPGRHSGIPCLDYHIDRCRAPCVGYIAEDSCRTAVWSHEAGGMGIIDHHQRVVFVGQIADAGRLAMVPSIEKTPSVAISRNRASTACCSCVSRSACRCSCSGYRWALQRPNAVDDRGVIQFVTDDRVFRPKSVSNSPPLASKQEE